MLRRVAARGKSKGTPATAPTPGIEAFKPQPAPPPGASGEAAPDANAAAPGPSSAVPAVAASAPKSSAAPPEASAAAAEPGAAVFQPGGRKSLDQGGLSTKRAAEDPEAAYWAYLRSAEPPGDRTALGTWGFQVGEAKSLDLPSYDDGGIDEAHPPNHATVWFPMPTDLSNKELKLLHERLANGLRTFALAHGPLFRPSDPDADAYSLRPSTT